MNLDPTTIAEMAAYAIDWCKQREVVHNYAGRHYMALEFEEQRLRYEAILEKAVDAEMAA